MSLLTLIEKVIPKKKVDPNSGVTWVQETLPVYHDHARGTNKTLWTAIETIQNDAVKAYYHTSTGTSLRIENKVIDHKKAVTQDGKHVLFNKKGKLISCNLNFTKDGYEKGQIYHFENLGFLGDLESIYITQFATDEFVFFSYLDNLKEYRVYTYAELKRYNPTLK